MDVTIHNLGDDLGPEKVLLLREPRAGLEAIVVVDNIACGPAIGGTRLAPDISVDEVFRLARAMTFKNAAAGLPHGGAKSGILANPLCRPERKERLIRTFARMIRHITEYIPGPDMGTDESCMAWVKDEIDRAIGLPWVLGGIPLDEIGATGYGLAVAAEVAAPAAGLSLDGARVAVQGFGAVGKNAARFLGQRGARLVAVSDIGGATINPEGLNVEALIAHVNLGSPMGDFPGGEPLARDALVGVDCEIWIPAARPDVLHEDNVSQLKSRLVLCGANIPATPGAEAWLHRQGILVVPDFIANAGGVICGAVEYRGGSKTQAMTTIEEKIRANTTEVLERARRKEILPRQAAVQMAMSRLEKAMAYRRVYC